MKKYKKLFLSFALVLGIIFTGTNLANSFTAQEVEMLITLLGLNSNQASTLRSMVSQTPATPCFTFTRNLKIGDSGAEVTNLVLFLNKQGYLSGKTDNFNEEVASAVVEFQEKYASEILIPNGLRKGSGYVGPSTRAKLNQFSCGNTKVEVPVRIPKVITPPITPPTVSNGYSYLPTDTNIQGSVVLVSANEDKAFKWDSNGRIHAPDWKWDTSMVNSGSVDKYIKRMILVHNTGGEGWATDSSANNPVGKSLYILASTLSRCDNCDVFNIQTDNLYRRVPAGQKTTFYLYGYPGSHRFTGGTLVVEFTDGTGVNIPIETSSITPNRINSNTEKYDMPVSSPANIFDTWSLGDNHMIRWSYPSELAGKSVSLVVSIVNPQQTKYWTIYENSNITPGAYTPLTGEVPWSLTSKFSSSQIPVGQYNIQVSAHDSSTGIKHKGLSGPLNISNKSIPSLVSVVYPKGGENMVSGDNLLVKWTPEVSVSEIEVFSMDRSYSFGIYGPKYGDSQPNTTGKFSYKIPSTIVGGNYYVRIKLSEDGRTFISNTFSINTIRQGSIKVLSPNGGQSFDINDNITVSVNLFPGNSHYINLSDSSRNTSYELISDVIGPSSGVYTFTKRIPSNLGVVAGDRFRIEVCGGALGDCDYSDSYFTITSSQTVGSCTDSDGGKYPDIAGLTDGRVNGIGSYFRDVSVASNGGQCSGDTCTSVAEGYCTSDGKVSNILMSCSTGRSSNGVCVPKPSVPPQNINLEMSLVDANSDKVSTNFNLGYGVQNTNPNDWHWKTIIGSLESAKTISEIEINNKELGNVWSTLNNRFYPLVVFKNGVQLNTQYGQKIDLPSGITTLDLYGQPEVTPFPGATATIRFTDGTNLAVKIPGSNIMQAPVGNNVSASAFDSLVNFLSGSR